MRLRRSWNVAVVLVAVSLVVTLQLVGATQTSAAVSEIAGAAVPNTAALDPAGDGNWSAFVALVFLAVANLVALARRPAMRRAEEPPPQTPWERLIAARY